MIGNRDGEQCFSGSDKSGAGGKHHGGWGDISEGGYYEDHHEVAAENLWAYERHNKQKND